MEIAINNEIAGRLVMEVYANVVPKTAKNFLYLCSGEKGVGKSGKPLHYKDCTFHRVQDHIFVQGGDIVAQDGSGGDSIYGRKFRDENFKLKHANIGTLSMANTGKNTNASQFFITLQPTPVYDKKHVVFGKVIDGMDVVKKIEQQLIAERVHMGRIPNDKQPRIVDCGVL
mmetsp:Transcript_20247/g.22507  ORF Transcript_20247/g.22507 Transcript_20247/m.22507 type:complete len:171 (-) Transcript_20247:86-598(-)